MIPDGRPVETAWCRSDALTYRALVSDIYVVTPGNSDEARARREAEEARVAQVRERWTERVSEDLEINRATVAQVVGTLFDHARPEGGQCPCGCHPRFATLHDGGFDCSCRWTVEQRKAAHEDLLAGGPWLDELRRATAREQRQVESWLSQHTGVVAERTCLAAPEVWEGEIDGRSFHFRERHGEWRIELDLAPHGQFAQRLTGHTPEGDMITEPVELTSGVEIAHGLDDDLGETAVEHLEFIVGTVRAHLQAETCGHEGARAFCPDCGLRMA